MALPTSTARSWLQSLEFPNRLFETGGTDYELYEEDDEFVLSIEMPGVDPEETNVTWDDGVLDVAAEHEDEERGFRRTYHRRFQLPREVDDEAITAEYNNGVLEVRLPVEASAAVAGTEIEVRS